MKTGKDEALDIAKRVAETKRFSLKHRHKQDVNILAVICGTHLIVDKHADMFEFAAKVLEIASLYNEKENDKKTDEH